MSKKEINILAIGIIVLVIGVTALVFIQKYKESASLPSQSENTTKVEENIQSKTDQPEVVQPVMPSEEDVANKSPEALVKEFYEWYIGNTDYVIYQIRSQNGKNVLDKRELVKSSPFVSSKYGENMEKRKGMYDGVLCTNDNEFNALKKVNKAQITGNTATVSILRGTTKNEDVAKIQVVLKKEKGWKINDIICIGDQYKNY